MSAETHTVYILRDGDGTALYVGETYNPDRRLRDHARKPWFSQVASIERELYSDHQSALDREKELIRQLAPPHNILRYGPSAVREPTTFFRVGVSPTQAKEMRAIAARLGFHFPACTRTNEEGNVTALLSALFLAAETTPERTFLALQDAIKPGHDRLMRRGDVEALRARKTVPGPEKGRPRQPRRGGDEA